MFLELIRELTDWLNDEDNGLVAMLATISLEAGDAIPDVGTIADETRNPLVAQMRFASTPGIAVNLQQIQMTEGQVYVITRDSTADVVIRIGRASVNTDRVVADTSYIARAIIKSLRLFNGDSRERNQIQVYDCSALALKPLWAPANDVIVTGAVVGTWTMRDTSP